MAININLKIEKKDLWIFSAILVFLLGVVYVIALDSGDYLTMGHTYDELEPCPNGQILKVSGGSWSCQNDNIGQARINTGLTTCSAPNLAIKTINPDTGAITCETDDTGAAAAGFTECVDGVASLCTDPNEHWTGTMCCVTGSPTCTTGVASLCTDPNEHWTGSMCCVSGVTTCTTGVASLCTDPNEHWTGTMCCVNDVICTTGVDSLCTDSQEHWTGSMCCVSGVTTCTTGVASLCTDSQEHWTGNRCCVE